MVILTMNIIKKINIGHHVGWDGYIIKKINIRHIMQVGMVILLRRLTQDISCRLGWL